MGKMKVEITWQRTAFFELNADDDLDLEWAAEMVNQNEDEFKDSVDYANAVPFDLHLAYTDGEQKKGWAILESYTGEEAESINVEKS